GRRRRLDSGHASLHANRGQYRAAFFQGGRTRGPRTRRVREGAIPCAASGRGGEALPQAPTRADLREGQEGRGFVAGRARQLSLNGIWLARVAYADRKASATCTAPPAGRRPAPTQQGHTVG